MANWVRDFLAENPELSNRVVKRARHALHTRNDDGTVTARFTGTPMHYQDERGEWQAIDTAIRRLPNGKLGAPGIPIEFDDDGQVNLEGYSQVTRRVGIYNANTGEFVQAFDLPEPKIDDDKLVREVGIYKHVITLKEVGLREELIIKEKPAQPVDTKLEDKTSLWLVMDTTITGQEFEDGLVDDDAKYEKGEFKFVPPKAGDANDKELSVKRHARKIEGKQHLLTGVRLDALNDAVYPVTIDPDFTGGTADGHIYGNDATYSTARSTSSNRDQISIVFQVGQRIPTTTYYVYRSFILFNTASIPDDANITQVNLKLTVAFNFSNTSFDVQIVKTDWSSNTDFSDATQRENAYDACLADDADNSIWRNTFGISSNTSYTSGNLSTAWVSKTGTTYYGLRSSRDESATAPSGNEYIQLYSWNETTESYRPVLVVTYTTPTAYTLACATGSYSLTGTACTLTVQRNYVLSCASATYTLTGTACTLTVQRNYVLSCASATYTLTGSDAGFEIHHTLAIDGGSYALAGVDVGLHRGYTLSASAGSFSLTGADVTLISTRILSAGAGSYALTGTGTGLHRGYTLSCNAGSYALMGVDATLTRGYTLSAGVGSYAQTGTDLSFVLRRNYTLSANAGSYETIGSDILFEIRRNYVLSAEAGSYSLTGVDVALISARTLSVEAGSYALTGTGAGLHRGYTLSCNAGSYALAGIGAGLHRGYSLSVIGGSYTLTGVDIAFEVLQHNYIIGLDAGEYTLTGKDAILTSARTLSVDAGDYTLSGTEASLKSERILSADAGNYILTGADVTLKSERTLSAGSGSYTLTGTDCTLTPQFNYTLALEAGSYTLTGIDIVLQRGFILSVDSGAYTLVGLDVSLLVGGIIIAEAGTYILTGSDATFLFTMITPVCRTLTIEAESRTLTIEAESRTLTIEACKDGG